MLFILGSVLAGVLLYDAVQNKPTEPSADDVRRSASAGTESGSSLQSVTYHVKSGEGEISLPPCRFMAVELGPSADPNKATLQIMVNNSVETEAKPITDIGKKKKYVKLTPTQYHANIILKTKEKSVVPITAYYST